MFCLLDVYCHLDRHPVTAAGSVKLLNGPWYRFIIALTGSNNITFPTWKITFIFCYCETLCQVVLSAETAKDVFLNFVLRIPADVLTTLC